MPSNQPWDELIVSCVKQALAGHIIFQKVTCSGCGERIGIEVPNRLYTKVRHDDGCGAITDCVKEGGGFMLAMVSDRSSIERIYGRISGLTIVEAKDGPQESGRKDRVEGVPPSGARS